MCYSVVNDLLVSIIIHDCKEMWEKSWLLLLGIDHRGVIIVAGESGGVHNLKSSLETPLWRGIRQVLGKDDTWSKLVSFLWGKTCLFNY